VQTGQIYRELGHELLFILRDLQSSVVLGHPLRRFTPVISAHPAIVAPMLQGSQEEGVSKMELQVDAFLFRVKCPKCGAQIEGSNQDKIDLPGELWIELPCDACQRVAEIVIDLKVTRDEFYPDFLEKK
jgi:hypothetical protein